MVTIVIVVELENIGGLTGKHRFEFKEGLNEVLAPNASGKTSLIKAILAMYASTYISPDQLLNIDAEEGHIKVVINGNEYVRMFKREGTNVIETILKPITTDDRLKYFVLDPYLGEIVRKIVNNADPDLTDYLVKVFKLDEYERSIESLRHEIESLSLEEKELSHSVEEIKAKDETKKKLEEEKEILKKKLKEFKGVTTEKVKQIQERTASLEEKLGRIEARIRDVRERLIPETKDRKVDVETELNRLENIVKEFYKQHKEPEKEIEEIKTEINNAEKLNSTLMHERDEYLKELDARIPIIRLATRTKAHKCPVCGQPIEKPDMFWSEREKLIEKEIKSRKEAIIKDYNKRIKKVNDEMKNLWKKLEEIQRKYNEIRELESMKIPNLKQELNKLSKSIEDYEIELKELEKEKDIKQKELEELRTKLSSEEQEMVKRRGEIERLLGKIEQQIKDLEESISKYSNVGEKLIEVRKLLKEKTDLLNKTEKELYETLNSISDEFSRLSLEVIKELGFTWLRGIKPHREGKKFTIRIIRVFPSGREYEQQLSTLSTSERMVVALVATLVGYKKRILDDYKGLAPILADEGLLAFDPSRYEKVLEELSKYGKYIIVTKLVEPEKVPKLIIVHR